MYQNDFSFSRLFRAYGRILDFKGRSTRTELLGYWIATWLISTAVGYATIFSTNVVLDRSFLFATLINLVLLIPAPGLAVRRAHDIGWPGVAALLLVGPASADIVIGSSLDPHPVIQLALSVAYIAGLVMLLWKPQDGENRYGPDPRLMDDRYGQEP